MVQKQQGATQGQRSGAKGRFFITPHAVSRYQSRIRPWLNRDEALAELVDLSNRCHMVRELANGCEMWRGPKPGRIRMIVGKLNSGLSQLITVLSEHDKVRECTPRG